MCHSCWTLNRSFIEVSLTFILIGLAIMLTPACLAYRAGAFDEADMTRWMMEQPFERILLFQLMVVCGLFLIGAGIAYAFTPSPRS